MCHTYVGQHEEYGIYKAHRRDPKEGIIKRLCVEDCKSIPENRKVKNEL